MLRGLLILFLLLNGAAAVPLRVVTFNIEAGFVGSERQPSLTAPGTPDYESIKDILARIDADVVCLQEVFPSDYNDDTGTSQNFASLASELGYPHSILATRSNSFDFQLRNAILSRYSFVDLEQIGSADYYDDRGIVGANSNRARELTRNQLAIVIDVPEAAQPTTIVTLHNKSRSNTTDQFRQAIELARLRDYLSDSGLNSNDNIIILGDFNLGGSPITFTDEPTTQLPSSWNRGADIALPISYVADPDFYFAAPLQLTALDARALDNSHNTTFGGSTLDFILTSPVIACNGSEIYHSSLDTANVQGLAKVGAPLPSATSSNASDHFAIFADFFLENAVPPPTNYSLTDASPQAVETFDNFGGNSTPPLWSVDHNDWQGFYSNQVSPANFSFDFEGDRSVGLFAGATPVTFSATFDNLTSTTIEALSLSYRAQQFTSNNPGTSDTFTASLSIAGASPIALPELTFTAAPSQNLPFRETLTTTIAGLAIAPESSFTLNLTAIQGPNNQGPVSDEVFLNEFHYDNSGSDVGQFIEVVVAPGFRSAGGSLSEIQVILYNGAPTQLSPYDTIPLSDFDNFSTPTISNGYEIFTHEANLQNGPDGIAIVIDGTLTQFLSYEGVFTPLEGPATGIESLDIGVAQVPAQAAGFGSIALTGAAIDSAGMTWEQLSETTAHTPGQLNPNQSFTGATPASAQAFSFDNVTVAIISSPDNDQDGDPDSSDPDDDNDQLPDTLEALLGTDPLLADTDNNGTLDGDEDSDGDGQSNLAELLVTLTDPTDQNDKFVACLSPHPNSAGDLALTFPTILGRNYQILSSQDPASLSPLTTQVGTGSEFTFIIPANQPHATFFAVAVSLDQE